MKKKRAIPFGYTIINGELAIDENEAEIIRNIFSEYRKGMTMSELASKMTRLSIPYCEKRVDWNKSVIARIIDNEKYTGIDGYLPIIAITEYREAQVCKAERTKKQTIKDDSIIGMIRAKVVCKDCGCRMVRIYEPRNRCHVTWNCSNQECKNNIKMSDDVMVLRIQEIMNLIIDNPSLLETDEPELNEKANDTIKDNQELKRLCDTNNYTEDELLKTVLAMTESRYKQLPEIKLGIATEIATAYGNAKQSENFDSELFLQTVDTILLDENGNITLKLKSNIEI